MDTTRRALLDEFPPGSPGRTMTEFPFVERAGLEVLHVERGRAVLRLPFEPNINHVGIIYAGALFTLAEVPGGVLFVSAFDISRFYPIVGELQIRFRSPARSSVMVDARMTDDELGRVAAELDQTGKARWELSQELVDESGTVVATSFGSYFGLSY